MKPKYFFLLPVFLAIPLIARAQSTFGSIVGVAQVRDGVYEPAEPPELRPAGGGCFHALHIRQNNDGTDR